MEEEVEEGVVEQFPPSPTEWDDEEDKEDEEDEEDKEENEENVDQEMVVEEEDEEDDDEEEEPHGRAVDGRTEENLALQRAIVATAPEGSRNNPISISDDDVRDLKCPQ